MEIPGATGNVLLPKMSWKSMQNISWTFPETHPVRKFHFFPSVVYRSADGIVLCYGQCSTSSLNLEVNPVVNVEDIIRPYILSRLLDVYTSEEHVCVLCLGATTLHPVVCL